MTRTHDVQSQAPAPAGDPTPTPAPTPAAAFATAVGNQALSRSLAAGGSPFQASLPLGVLARKSSNPDFGDAEPAQHPGSHTEVKPGETGYADALAEDADQMTDPMMAFHEKDVLTAVAPDNSGVDAQIRTREGEMRHADAKMADGDKSKWYGGNPGTVRKMWLDGKSFAQGHKQEIEEDKAELGRVAQAFGSQLPTMNSTFTSMARLDAMKGALGVGRDADLAATLVKGIADARAVVQGYLTDYRGDPTKPGAPNKQNTTEELKAPSYAGSLAKHQKEVALAGREMNTAYTELQADMLATQAAKIEKEADEPEERLKEIQTTKDGLKAMGKGLDTGFAIVNAAPATITKAETTFAKTQAGYGAMRNKQAIVKGQFGKHNPTYLTVDEKGNFVVKNTQTGTTKNADGSPTEEQAEAPADTSVKVELPMSVESALGKMADFYYADEVRKLTLQVQNIKDRASTLKKISAAQKLAATAEKFQTALLKFGTACNEFQTAVNQRREDYREMGRKLDHFAQRSPEMKKAGLDVKNFGDRFTTLFTVIAQVRETLALGKGGKVDPLTGATSKDLEGAADAGSVAKSSSALIALKGKFKGRRAKRKLWVNQLKVTDQEITAIDEMKGQLRAYDEKTKPQETDFSKVEVEFQGLLKELTKVPANADY